MKGTITKGTDWTNFKNYIQGKKISIQFVDDDASIYDLFAIDGSFILECIIKKTNPRNSDQIDFEDNFQNKCNSRIAYSVGSFLIDRSGTTSNSPNTSTLMMPQNINRQYLLIQNINSRPIWINFSIPATVGSPSIRLVPGAIFIMEGAVVSTEAVYVLGEGPNVVYTAKEI